MRARSLRRPLSDWRVSPIAPDVPAEVEAATDLYLDAQRAWLDAYARWAGARLDRNAIGELKCGKSRLDAAREALAAAIGDRTGYFPVRGRLVGIVSTPYGREVRVIPGFEPVTFPEKPQ